MPSEHPQFSAAMRDVRESEIAQVWKLGFEIPDVVGLWVGEGDLPTPAFVCEAAAKALRAGHTFYTHKSGIPELRAALARYHRRVYGIEPTIERSTVTGSGMNGILMLMQALLDPGDSVAVVTPCWPNVFAAIGIQGGVCREVPLAPAGDRWRLDLDRLFAACDASTKAMFIVSPGNPTGWMMTAEEQSAVLAFCIATARFARSPVSWKRASHHSALSEAHVPTSSLALPEIVENRSIACSSRSSLLRR